MTSKENEHKELRKRINERQAAKLGRLRNYEHDHNDNFKKQLVLWAKQQLCMCITLFSPLLWRPLNDYDLKLPNATCYRGHGHMTTNSTPGKVACIWHIERVQIDAIKFERAQSHFLATFSLPSSSSLLKLPTDAYVDDQVKSLITTSPLN